ncbi:golgin subfamily A member 1 [Sitodiplosis mosellana]|uniref:golgin subfamily A member 1 n=1 Tax=Sitodiplosis mosellana TaxID=263140 RepID=UPI0024447447|nr:golgin subfamily A member 1 [Sitodiplosis mosellana]XP_055316784.1 golgin subfamily A member 1 [Sitodiplosis mosellana]
MMFTSLKNRIREETGNDVCASHPAFTSHRRNSLSVNNLNNNNNNNIIIDTSQLGAVNSNGTAATLNNNQQSRFTANISPIDQLNAVIAQKNDEINQLIEKLNESDATLTKLSTECNELAAIKDRLEKSNAILDDALKVAQEQKEMIHSEQDKIQNLQAQEISKLKSLLHFREQEAIDRLSTIKRKDNQLEQLQMENVRLRELEANFENIQDELEKLRHSAQMEKNSLTATLASMEEHNRHLTSKLQIYEEGRINFTMNQSNDEKMQILLRERRMLEQRLEEAHLHLSDIKSTWSAQNMALETQVDRLSRQVAAETTEKRKALTAHDQLAEKCKQLAFQLEKSYVDIEQRDQKIKLMSEEIDDLSSTYQDFKDQNEEEVTFLRNKVNKNTNEIDELKQSLETTMDRLNTQSDETDQLTRSLNGRVEALQTDLYSIQTELEKEKKEKNTIVLKNAEISQNEERLKQQLRNESHEMNEMCDTVQKLTDERNELEARLNEYHQQLESVEDLRNEISDKNKAIKILNQRLSDMKKTLQNELKSSSNEKVGAIVANNSNAPTTNGNIVGDSTAETDQLVNNNSKKALAVVMDDVNFAYLKHVILKFLTSREVEARHLIKAIGTLLHLNHEEEQLLHETLNFKVGWFGSRTVDVTTRNRHHKLLSVPSPSLRS